MSELCAGTRGVQCNFEGKLKVPFLRLIPAEQPMKNRMTYPSNYLQDEKWEGDGRRRKVEEGLLCGALGGNVLP